MFNSSTCSFQIPLQVKELLLNTKYFGSISWSTLHHEKFYINQNNELSFIINCSKKKASPYIDKKGNNLKLALFC